MRPPRGRGGGGFRGGRDGGGGRGFRGGGGGRFGGGGGRFAPRDEGPPSEVVGLSPSHCFEFKMLVNHKPLCKKSFDFDFFNAQRFRHLSMLVRAMR